MAAPIRGILKNERYSQYPPSLPRSPYQENWENVQQEAMYNHFGHWRCEQKKKIMKYSLRRTFSFEVINEHIVQQLFK